MSTSLRLLVFLLLVSVAHAAKVNIEPFASIDLDQVAAAGLNVERKNDMPDFRVTYFKGPKADDVIGVYEGDYPSLFSSRGEKLGEVKGTVADQPVIWICWSEVKDGKKQFGSETSMWSRRVVLEDGNRKVEAVQQFHIFIFRQDAESLSAARDLVKKLIKKEPNKAPVPTPASVTPAADAPVAPAAAAAHL